MPIALSNEERSVIKKKLLEAAEISLTKYGVKKTTVDSLVQKVNIPKGTFYLFYPSKAMLLYEVFQIKHDELQNDLVTSVLKIKDDISPTIITELIFDIYKKLDSSFLLSFMTNGDLELVMSQLPIDVINQHIESDELSLDRILSIIPNVNEKMKEIYSASLRLVMSSILHKREIGVELYDKALKLSVMGIIIQIFKEAKK